jgi:hypothetical protein
MDNQNELNNRISKSMNLPSEKKFYFNGFIVAISPSDIAIGLEVNGEPVLLLNTTIPVAKEFVKILNDTINNHEKKMDFEFPSLHDLEMRIEKNNAKPR